MNTNHKKLFPLVLSAVLLFSGYAGQETADAAADLSTGFHEEAFSDRDLSGEYDVSEAVTISLSGTAAEADSDAVQISGSIITITEAGTYVFSGTLDNGNIVINADKEDKVIFGGRLGEYRYYDMDQVIASALEKSKYL